MCFFKATKKMVLLNIRDMLPIKATFSVSVDVRLSVAGEKLHFGERRRENWTDKKKNINGRVIYVAGSNHTMRGRLPFIPYMETCMRVE